MILVCGGLDDLTTGLVCARLTVCGYDYRLLDLAAFPAGCRLLWRWQRGGPAGYIATPEWRLGLDEITSVYYRILPSAARRPLDDLPAEQAPSVVAEADSALSLLWEQMPCLVVNRPSAGLSNGSKLYQALHIRACGLLIPPTLVTSDPAAVQRFYEENDGRVIYKSLSGVRSIVRRMEAQHFRRLEFLRKAPTQFQAYIEGENVRVHVVGEKVLATRVHSSAVDYRYAHHEGKTATLTACDLPAEIATTCRQLTRRLGLAMSGIDLMRTPDGRYYCFEVNPMPAFSYYELNGGQAISLALAEFLQHGGYVAPPEQPISQPV